MKFLLLITLISFSSLFGETIYFDVSGDYASIDVAESKTLIETLTDQSLSYGKRYKVAQEIAENSSNT